MLQGKKIIISISSVLFVSILFAQHPDLKKIDSLRSVLASARGIQKIDCINALGEESWWPPKIWPDSISLLAQLAKQESEKINYPAGVATAIMLSGVAEIYRKKFLEAEKYLQQAIGIFEKLHNDFGLGWCNVWLGQTLYSQNEFTRSLVCYQKSILFLDKIGDWEGKGKAWVWMAFDYVNLGDYDSSFYYCSKSLLLRQKMSDYVCASVSLTNMGQLYKAAGSYEDALDYYKQGYSYANSHDVDFYTTNWAYLEPVGAIFRMMNLTDSSYYYLQRARQLDPNNDMTRISFAETLLLKNELDSALAIFLQPIDKFRKGEDRWDLMRVTLDAAKTYYKKKDAKMALKYAYDSYQLAEKSKARQYILENYSLLSKIYKDLNRQDSAFYFLSKFTALKDSIVNNQFLWKLSNYKRQEEFKKQMNQVALLDKVNKGQENELRQRALLQWILIACLLIVALSGFIVYKNLMLKRKNEKLESLQRQAGLQQHVSELEMQALRAQMNPHFIFNCLSSINRFILINESEAASNYLTKFSRLIRMALNNSKKTFISIEDELETLTLYMEMEKLRFKDSFDYTIRCISPIDKANIFIPPLLLQPFVENSIWHGLMHKEGQGHITIELGIEGNILCCVITDNGIGRAQSATMKSKSADNGRPMGLNITTERLALLNEENNKESFLKIEDIFDRDGQTAGTRVVLKVNYKELAEVATSP
jgi:Histidine kinase/Tetratricopeptide repeat